MTGYQPVLTNYIQGVNNDVVGKIDVNSVDTADVGNVGINLGNILTPFIGAINNFVFYTGTANPDSTLGIENDVYAQTNGGTSLVLWRKNTTSWVVQSTIPLGISYQDGIIIGLRTQIDLDTRSVSVSSGNWAINNIIYSKGTPTFITYNVPETGSNRIDTIYANTSNQILYLAGAPSATPVKPTLPADTIEVDSIYVPASGTGSAYLFTQGTSNNVSTTIRTEIPITADGDFVIANWQTDLVPNDPNGRTYVQRFGNVIRDVKGMQDLGGSVFGLYSPSDVRATYSGASITTVTIYTLFIGKISII